MGGDKDTDIVKVKVNTETLPEYIKTVHQGWITSFFDEFNGSRETPGFVYKPGIAYVSPLKNGGPKDEVRIAYGKNFIKGDQELLRYLQSLGIDAKVIEE